MLAAGKMKIYFILKHKYICIHLKYIKCVTCCYRRAVVAHVVFVFFARIYPVRFARDGLKHYEE